MNNKKMTIPVAMLTRKFYCHKCGEKLSVEGDTKTVSTTDPEYTRYNKIRRWRMIGDVDVTTYHFECEKCNTAISFDEQTVIENIQKMMGKQTLTDEEISAKRSEAEAMIEKKKNKTYAWLYGITAVLFVIIFALIIIFK